MFALFAFAVMGTSVIMCDMIRSGELMKYPLAMVKWLLDQTLMRSSLGATTTAMRMQGVVPAFHGHAHKQSLPNRMAPASNHLALRPDSPHHSTASQQIDEHFKFHDEDKHAASGNFIYQNYRQALEKIAINAGQLSLLESSLGTTAADYEHYPRYREPEDVQRTVDYIGKLQKHADASAASDQAKTEFKRLDFNILTNGYTKPQITLEDLCRFEEAHGIEVRWMPDSKDTRTASPSPTQRKYREALTEVERLVVQRLFELTKLGMSGLTYNMRDKISKALKTRSEAIRRAIVVYNQAASLLTPPRERPYVRRGHPDDVTCGGSTSCATLAQDIRLQPWTQPERREAMVLHYGIKRAKEEVRSSPGNVKIVIRIVVDGVPPPYWLATELGVKQMAVEYEEVVDSSAGSDRP
ncbi:hypothetical protein B0H14DRAFT_2646345 [Mycena olivaceomarginata]|nr:hypothetical protein B0H14DRAFT_2646345 [Mycena olivaceomarginata]